MNLPHGFTSGRESRCYRRRRSLLYFLAKKVFALFSICSVESLFFLILFLLRGEFCEVFLL